jgi:excinuclease ABC subunit A
MPPWRTCRKFAEINIDEYLGEATAQVKIPGLGSLQHLLWSPFCEIAPHLIDMLRSKGEMKHVRDWQHAYFFLQQFGCEHILLGQSAACLSTGEKQILRLYPLAHKSMQGFCIVLDEPGTGLDRKKRKVLRTFLDNIRSRGDTVLIIDHHDDWLNEEDWLVELGPGAGAAGGRVIFEGVARNRIVQPSNTSIGKTLAELRKPQRLEENLSLALARTGSYFEDDHIEVPRAGVTLLCGPTGSGKTRLFREIETWNRQSFRKVILFDGNAKLSASKKESRLGRVSSVASFLGIAEDVRELFSQTKEAKVQGLSKKDFSLSQSSSRCVECSGQGSVSEADEWEGAERRSCPACRGMSFAPHILAARFRGRNIFEFLEMPVVDLAKEFHFKKKLHFAVAKMLAIGLSYISLGAVMQRLSTGERFRLQLLRELLAHGKESKTEHILLLDEPSAGLHSSDLQLVMAMLEELRTQQGWTILIAEHEVMADIVFDHLLDMQSLKLAEK